MNGFDWLREHLQSFFYIPVLGFAPPSPPILGGEQLKVPKLGGFRGRNKSNLRKYLV